MGTRQTKNNSRQDTQQGKSENKGKSDRRKTGAHQGTGFGTQSAGDAKKGVSGSSNKK